MVAAVLDEMQFDLDNFVFGNHMPVFVDEEGFDPGDPDKITQDGSNPITGARMCGRHRPAPGSWTFACHVDGTDIESALEYAAQMGSKWRDEKWHTSVAMLRYHLGGRTRCVFGRPRRFSFKPNNRILGGYVPPLASFDLVDAKHYDDQEGFTDIGLLAPVTGGFEVPFEAPLTIDLEVPSVQPGVMEVGGDTTTSPVIEFYGPLTNGSVKVGDLTYGFTGTINAGGVLTIDPRPWAMTVTRKGSMSNVVLTRTTRLTRALVSPGLYEVAFRGTDETGTARCRVRWRNAYSTL